MKKSSIKIIVQVTLLLLVIGGVLLVYMLAGKNTSDQGKEVYEKHCANCHGNRGEGLRQLIPPLNDPRSLEFSNLVCTIRYGKSGPVTVNNIVYDRPMPSNFQLENDEITAVINFIYSDLNSIPQKATLPRVNQALESCN